MNRTSIAFTLGVCMAFFANCFVSKNALSDRPIPGKSWDLILPNSGLNMAWVAPGTFMMGSLDSEPGHKAEESPSTKVTLTKGFWLGKTEVTIGQWKSVTGESLRDHVKKMLDDETVYDFGDQKRKLREFMNFRRDDPESIMANESEGLPMYFVSWNDAMEFCKKLNVQEKLNGHLPAGYEYTLPTEAQWEYACRAGTTTATFAGALAVANGAAPVLNDIAWYGSNSSINYQGKKLGNSGAGPRNAGEKKANSWGLQDMSGNLWEWCRDWYGPYPGESITDPVGPATGSGRVNRGGSWGSGAFDQRSATRALNPQPEKSAYRGFRLALAAIQ